MRSNRREPLVLLLASVLAVGFLELGLRAAGNSPWAPPPTVFEVTPADWIRPDPTHGWALRPGQFTVAFDGGPTAAVAHDDEGRRVTPPGRGRVLELHGGSFVYGFGLSDADSMGWRLQARLPDHDVRVRAVPGHGPLQALTALQVHRANGTAPYAMVVGYVAFHDERITWNRSWQRALSGSEFALSARPWLMPAVRTRSGRPQLESIDPRLSLLPGAPVLAAVARLDRLRDDLQERRLRSSEVARNLLVELHREAKAHGTYVLVVGLSNDEATGATLEHLRGHGVLTLDAGLDWTDPSNQLGPHDPHPNAAAADHWARAVADLVHSGAGEASAGAARPR